MYVRDTIYHLIAFSTVKEITELNDKGTNPSDTDGDLTNCLSCME